MTLQETTTQTWAIKDLPLKTEITVRMHPRDGGYIHRKQGGRDPFTRFKADMHGMDGNWIRAHIMRTARGEENGWHRLWIMGSTSESDFYPGMPIAEGLLVANQRIVVRGIGFPGMVLPGLIRSIDSFS